MREFFGYPDEGTFLAWLADGGLWAIVIGVGALLGWLMLRRLTRRWRDALLISLDGFVERLHLDYSISGHRRFYIILTDILIGVVIIGGTASLAGLSAVGVDIEPALDALAVVGAGFRSWWGDHGIAIALIALLAWLANKVIQQAIPRLMRAFVLRVSATQVDAAESAKRTDTLAAVARGAIRVLIFMVAFLTILQELTVPIGPVLGGFGVAGIAIGFGAQWLIRDLINGIFIIAENQYRQGDVVEIAGVTGLVESINLRRTTLRDLDGKVHVVPNGEVSVSSNFTKHWSRVNLDVGVAYKEDMDHVFRVLNEIGASMSDDPYFGDMIIETPQVLRLDSFDDSAITIKMLGVCKPLKQWEVKGEMRRRIKARFDAEGIEIPFPHRTVYWGYGANPVKGNQGTEYVALETAPDGNEAAASGDGRPVETQGAAEGDGRPDNAEPPEGDIRRDPREDAIRRQARFLEQLDDDGDGADDAT